MEKKILKYEILGIFFISILGSLLHFTFDWLGRFWLAGAFSAVNESTWEHLKLAVVPAALWMVMEIKLFKIEASNFFPAKAIGIFLMPISIIVLFYSYTAALGDNFFVFDILTFVIAVVIGQVAGYKIMMLQEIPKKYDSLSIISIILLLISFVLFTFYPPHIFLFKDPASGFYGIIQ